MKEIKIYCDGACSGNPGPGGWGAVLLWNEHTKKLSGGSANTTNNQMELRAAIEGLKAIKKVVKVAIYTDSQYVKNGITTWIHSWKKNGWNKGKVKNIELWKELDDIASKHEVKWHWVKGHNGDKYNEMADELATSAIKDFK